MLGRIQVNQLVKRLELYSIQKARYSNNVRNLHKAETLVVKYETGDLILNSGTLARLADSSATGSHSDTNILVTVVSKTSKTPSDFMPLTVNYAQKSSASGRIPTSFNRRDSYMSNQEILISRVIDRSIRPLFASGFTNETQIICSLLSHGGKQSPDVVAVNTVSYALQTSDLPWYGPIGCVRVGMVGKDFVANPTVKMLKESPLNLVVTINPNNHIVMLEGWADNLNQNKFIDAIQFGVKEAGRVSEVIKSSAYTNKLEKKKPAKDEVFYRSIESLIKLQMHDIYTTTNHDKMSRDEAVNLIRSKTLELMKLDPNFVKYFRDPTCRVYNEYFTSIAKETFRSVIIDEEKRCDGRTLSQLRPISCKLNALPSLHGSALFQRGQTQVLCSLTFDSPEAMYKTDAIANMVSPSLTKLDKKFMLHYEFPQYAVNEIGRIGGRGDRREIGHGALAEKAVYPIVPTESNFTIRLLCEVMESNGSSSMASVCAGSLALVDAGVPIQQLAAGVAMGLVTRLDENENIKEYKIITDLAGIEDFMGDTDFKIAGTRDGITAVQADIKIEGLPLDITRQLIEKSQTARNQILDIMKDAVDNNASNKKTKCLPVLKQIKVAPQDRSKFVGLGGMNIKRIENATGVTITSIDELTFSLFAPNADAYAEAEELINSFLESNKEPEFEYGGVYAAKVVQILEGGVTVKLHPSMKPVMLPNSQLEARKIMHGSMSGLKEGQEIQVKYFGRDPVTGSMRLSRKVLFMSAFRQQNLLSKKTGAEILDMGINSENSENSEKRKS